ncbi:MAG: ABC transporter permease [Actinomycetota bacterium]|nr:ABC transporter permease [Actinomycetota bacterium]
MLEGASVGQAGQAIVEEASAAAVKKSVRVPAPESDAPRREIWFRRRVSLTRALRELWHFRELIVTLAERDLRVRYKQAVLGFAWAVITPVIMMIAFTLVFTKVVHGISFGKGIPYVLGSYIGLIPWTFFSTCVQSGGMSLVNNVGLLNKLYCPREVFPIAAIIDAIFDAFIATLVLLLLFPIEGFAPKVEAFYIPLLMIPLLAFTLGVTLIVSSVLVFMRDLRLVLPLIVQMGLFLTPVIYSPKSLTSSEGLVIGWSVLNPLVPVLDGLRRTVLQGQAPQWIPYLAGTASSLLILVGGFILFKRLETGIADVA